jgi:hypothetical protein
MQSCMRKFAHALALLICALGCGDDPVSAPRSIGRDATAVPPIATHEAGVSVPAVDSRFPSPSGSNVSVSQRTVADAGWVANDAAAVGDPDADRPYAAHWAIEVMHFIIARPKR